MKAKKYWPLVSTLLCFLLGVQCLLYIQAQRRNEEHFIQNFCTIFSVFSTETIACTDFKSLDGPKLSILYNSLSEASTYCTIARPVSVGLLKPPTSFASDFDTFDLALLQQHLGSLTTKVSDGETLDSDDLEWFSSLQQNLIILNNALYQDSSNLREEAYQETYFISAFQSFLSALESQGD